MSDGIFDAFDSLYKFLYLTISCEIQSHSSFPHLLSGLHAAASRFLATAPPVTHSLLVVHLCHIFLTETTALQ